MAGIVAGMVAEERSVAARQKICRPGISVKQQPTLVERWRLHWLSQILLVLRHGHLLPRHLPMRGVKYLKG